MGCDNTKDTPGNTGTATAPSDSSDTAKDSGAKTDPPKPPKNKETIYGTPEMIDRRLGIESPMLDSPPVPPPKRAPKPSEASEK